MLLFFLLTFCCFCTVLTEKTVTVLTKTTTLSIIKRLGSFYETKKKRDTCYITCEFKLDLIIVKERVKNSHRLVVCYLVVEETSYTTKGITEVRWFHYSDIYTSQPLYTRHLVVKSYKGCLSILSTFILFFTSILILTF